jgi:hypothetical protein
MQAAPGHRKPPDQAPIAPFAQRADPDCGWLRTHRGWGLHGSRFSGLIPLTAKAEGRERRNDHREKTDLGLVLL